MAYNGPVFVTMISKIITCKKYNKIKRIISVYRDGVFPPFPEEFTTLLEQS